MNLKKAKRLRAEAKAEAKQQMLPFSGYNVEEHKRERLLPVTQKDGTLALQKVEVILKTYHTHPGTERGIYKYLKRQERRAA